MRSEAHLKSTRRSWLQSLKATTTRIGTSPNRLEITGRDHPGDERLRLGSPVCYGDNLRHAGGADGLRGEGQGWNVECGFLNCIHRQGHDLRACGVAIHNRKGIGMALRQQW